MNETNEQTPPADDSTEHDVAEAGAKVAEAGAGVAQAGADVAETASQNADDEGDAG